MLQWTFILATLYFATTVICIDIVSEVTADVEAETAVKQCSQTKCESNEVCRIFAGVARCIPRNPCSLVHCPDTSRCILKDNQPLCLQIEVVDSEIDMCAKMTCDVSESCIIRRGRPVCTPDEILPLPDFIMPTSCDDVTCFGNSKCVVIESGQATCQAIDDSQSIDVCSTILCTAGRKCVFRLGIAECLSPAEINVENETRVALPVSK